jgi:hypothetical protein
MTNTPSAALSAVEFMFDLCSTPASAEEMKGTTARCGLPLQGQSEPAPAKGAGWDGLTAKGAWTYSSTGRFREATLRWARAQSHPNARRCELSRSASPSGADRVLQPAVPARFAGGSQRRTSELSDCIDSSSSR